MSRDRDWGTREVVAMCVTIVAAGVALGMFAALTAAKLVGVLP